MRTVSSAVGLIGCLAASLLVAAPMAQARATRDVTLVERELVDARDAARIPLLLELATLREDEPAAVIRLADEALALLAGHPSPRDEVRARNARSFALQVRSDYKESLAEAQRALAVAQRAGDESLVGDAQFHIALTQWRLGDYAAALATAESAHERQKARGDSRALADTLRLIGGIHQSQGDLDRALAHQLASLQVAEAINDRQSIGRSHNNIGLVYWELHRYDDGLAALRRALGIHELVGPRTNLSNTLNNIGLILMEMKRPREAIPYLERSLALDREAGNRYGEAKVLNNLGWVHQALREPDRAREYHQRSLALREQIGDPEGIVRGRGALAEKIDDRIDQSYYSQMLARAREATGDVSGAYKAFRKYHELETALAESRLRQRTHDLEARYRLREQQRELASAETLADSRRRQLVWALGGAAVMAISLLLLGVLYRERGRAQQALAESQQRYRSLFQSSVVPTFLVDVEEGTLLDRNDAANALCGASTGGRTTIDAVQPEWVRRALTRLTGAVSGDQVAFDDSWTEPTGLVRWFEVRGSAVTIDGGRRWLATVRDTTEHHQAEASQQREDKMRSLGLLAGGIAHDFNNALTAIIGHIELARDAEPGEREDLLRRAEEGATGASRITGQLLAFARGGQPVRRSAELTRLLPDAVALAGAGSRMRIDIEIADGVWPADVDAGQFGQVVGNLVINAQQASDGRGRLQVRVTNASGDLLPESLDHSNRYVRLDFVDDGPGIPAAIRDRLFEPYFTTKQGGHGLGLATAYAICRNHGGALTCTSQEGHGATFTAFFPAAAEAPAVVPAATERAPRGGGRILALDDEPPVRNIVQRMLTASGYDVETVAEGRQAVERYLEARHHGQPFDLLIMDLTIPGGMGGRDALAEILRHDPRALAIVASGYSDDPTMANYREAGFVGALPKPFHRDQLERLVADVLKDRRPDDSRGSVGG